LVATAAELLEDRTLLSADFGDAPVPYPVTLAENGAEHAGSGPTLGATRDVEADGTHSLLADADGADEDGVVDAGTNFLVVGQTGVAVTINVQNAPSGAKLDGWADWNADGDWDDVDEQMLVSVAVVNGDNLLTFNVPATASVGVTFTRLRLSTAGGLGVTGSAADGEVEDYPIEISAQADFGDAPSPYPVTRSESGAQHLPAGPTLGATRDEEVDGIHSAAADGDGSDEDGVVSSTGDDIIAGNVGTTVTVNVQGAASGAKLDAWMDFNADGDWDDAGEQILVSESVVNGDNLLTYDVPVTARVGVTFARLRVSTAGGLGVTGTAADGEVEDYEIEIVAVEDLVFNFGSGDNTIVLSDNGVPDDGIFRLTSTSPSETFEYTSPSGTLTINSGDGADVITLSDLEAGTFSTMVNGQSGDDTIDASAMTGPVKLNGSGGDDFLTGGSAGDTLNGGAGADSLVGNDGDDLLQGQGGSLDILTGGLGDDDLDGGAGYNHVSESADVDFTASPTLLSGLGNDRLERIHLLQIFGGPSANTIDLSGFFGRAFINGAGGNDTLTGGRWYDRIFGGAGRDLISSRPAITDSGTGLLTYDVMRGQGGNFDTLVGGDGNDKLNGGAGHDILFGHGGDDRLTGESGDDTIDGGPGTDRLLERDDVDMTLTDIALTGGMGTDLLISIETAYLKGGAGDNRLDGSDFGGDMTLVGVGGDDTLLGGAGNDAISGRAGDDSITGGDGDDTLLGLRGNDVLNGGAGSDFLDGGTQDDSISGWTGDDVVYGRSGNDILVGGDGHDTMFGASGNDILQGDDGKAETTHLSDDDQLDGGSGTDTIRGGDGSDTIVDGASEVDEAFTFWAAWVDAV
jgi:Ca2+-binding RTX toxin-like protein